MNSMFRDALRARLTPSLVCPKCTAANRPGATVIEIDQTGSRGFCCVCSREGPIETFQPQTSKEQ